MRSASGAGRATRCSRRSPRRARRKPPWLELLARLALCERGDATVEELAALREVVEGLTEGLDMPAVARARDLVSRRRAPALA